MTEIHAMPVPSVYVTTAARSWEMVIGRGMAARAVSIADIAVIEAGVAPVAGVAVTTAARALEMVCRRRAWMPEARALM